MDRQQKDGIVIKDHTFSLFHFEMFPHRFNDRMVINLWMYVNTATATVTIIIISYTTTVQVVVLVDRLIWKLNTCHVMMVMMMMMMMIFMIIMMMIVMIMIMMVMRGDNR